MNIIEAIEANKNARVRMKLYSKEPNSWWKINELENRNSFTIGTILAEWEVEKTPQVIEFDLDFIGCNGTSAVQCNQLAGRKWYCKFTEVIE